LTPGQGPCARVACGCPELPDHEHGFDGVKTYCSTCGSDACPSYKPPSKKPCARCGVPGNIHASLTGRQLHYIPQGVCPWWVRPAPWPVRALTRALDRFRL
jgi:hypothetical protein